MARIRKARPTPRIGDRVRFTENTSWSGIVIPVDTTATVYEHVRPNGEKWGCLRIDGYPTLQPNGYPYGMGSGRFLEVTH